MELTIDVSDSCVKKIKALTRLKGMDADEIETYLSDGLESVVMVSICDELGMEPTELYIGSSPANVRLMHKNPTAEMISQPKSEQENTQAEIYNENQHVLSSESDDVPEEVKETEDPQFSFVDPSTDALNTANIENDDDLLDGSLLGGDAIDDDDEPIVARKATKARDAFTTPKVKISDATY